MILTAADPLKFGLFLCELCIFVFNYSGNLGPKNNGLASPVKPDACIMNYVHHNYIDTTELVSNSQNLCLVIIHVCNFCLEHTEAL